MIYRYGHSVRGGTSDASVRFGVTNFTDELPSYPTLTHGDILGRRYYAGLKVRF